MKRGSRTMLYGLGLLVFVVLGAMAFVRLAPTNTAQWHSAPASALWDQSSPWDQVVALTGAATLRLSDQKGPPAELLAKLDAIAMATPRTTRLAGSVADGMITWQTRSALWGFPDFTTAQIRPDGLYLHARLRFGTEDMGVNAKRLAAWLAAL